MNQEPRCPESIERITITLLNELQAIVDEFHAACESDNPDGQLFDVLSLKIDALEELLSASQGENAMGMQIDLIHREPGSPLIFLANEEVRTEVRLSSLRTSANCQAARRAAGTLAEHAGEVWQYLGTSFDSDRGEWAHTFRHRCHPRTRERTYRYVPAIVALTLSELEPEPASYYVTHATQIGFDGQQTVWGIYQHALLVVGVEEFGARIYYGDATLVDRKLGERYLPDSVLLDWAHPYAMPASPAFVWRLDPYEEEQGGEPDTMSADIKGQPSGCPSG